MNTNDYRRFVNKAALGLLDLTDAQKANPRIVLAVSVAKEQIKQKAEAEAKKAQTNV